ncbi:MAG: hypothetical protein Q8L06_03595, partial [Pseudohongiella sp.]|nr:hypothetical protein [Pseudohongiella sp.]
MRLVWKSLLACTLGLCLIPALYGQTEQTPDDPAPVTEQAVQMTEPATLESLLLQLTDASLGEAAALIPQLEEQGGRTVLPLFTAMLANELVFDPTTRQLYIRSEVSNTVSVRDVFTNDDAAESLSIDSLERIRLNNRLRVLLRDGIARISLFEGNERERQAAA